MHCFNSAMPVLLLLLLGAALLHARPQDLSTNNIVREEMTEEEGESLVASLILAVAHDWDLGREEVTEFVRTVPSPAVSVNGTTSDTTSHPRDESRTISLSASSEERLSS
ncbi:Serine/threonine-protein phosphatase 2A regulatory subunit B'' subunit gamma [Frankliniella fusca]|uniref:Serine/threonine-protein phosphatase 2A regulatory subunit B'' subunit gamma n=1 Tax=Frankliniella fusca TaxID=407009 RepID=A0AAE1LH55_9NEOP|nr:Serine/threonine-protein phosphatase 2A regulatory subunit B'' subunit gamma [Frankliniella fusca]